MALVLGLRSGMAVTALVCLVTGTVVMPGEQSPLSQYGNLIGPHDSARLRVRIPQLATFMTVILALAALWRVDARR